MNSITHTPILQAMELFVDSNVDTCVEANDTCFVGEKTCLLLSFIIGVSVEVPNCYGLLLLFKGLMNVAHLVSFHHWFAFWKALI
jgi:hypothetical protein